MAFEPKHRNSVKAPETTEERMERTQRLIEESRKATETPIKPEPAEKDKKEKKPKAEKTKTKKPGAEIPASKETSWPIKGRINEYGFLHFSKNVLEKLGWYQKIDERRSKKVDVTLDFESGALIVKKKSS